MEADNGRMPNLPCVHPRLREGGDEGLAEIVAADLPDLVMRTDAAHRGPQQAEAQGEIDRACGSGWVLTSPYPYAIITLSPAWRLVSTPSIRLFQAGFLIGVLTMATEAPNLAAMRACMQQKDNTHNTAYSAFAPPSTFMQLEMNDCAHLIRTLPSTANMRSVTAYTLTCSIRKDRRMECVKRNASRTDSLGGRSHLRMVDEEHRRTNPCYRTRRRRLLEPWRILRKTAACLNQEHTSRTRERKRRYFLCISDSGWT